MATKKRAAAKPAGVARLTPKQALFVEEYLVDLNATQAAIRAGYSADTAYSIGNELLKKPEIAAAIREAMNKRSERTHILQDRVVQELAAIGFSKITDLVAWKSYDLLELQARMAEQGEASSREEWDEDGEEGVSESGGVEALWFTDVKFKDSSQLPENLARAVASISKDAKGKLKISMHDKKSALISLLRHTGGFDQKAKLTAEGDGSVTVEIRRFGE